MSNDGQNQTTAKQGKSEENFPEWLSVVHSQVASLKFGTVQITVHDSNVVQIERIEKTRLDRPR